jgi:hypothetical protein
VHLAPKVSRHHRFTKCAIGPSEIAPPNCIRMPERPADNLKVEGVVSDYAVGGAMALAFWSEATATFDLDVFVLLEQEGLVVSLDPIYAWARRHGYEVRAEHILIADVPVQVVPAPNALAAEAVASAEELDYDGLPVRVITPEYLIAMYLEGPAATSTRRERAARLLDQAELDRELLNSLVERYNLRLPQQG